MTAPGQLGYPAGVPLLSAMGPEVDERGSVREVAQVPEAAVVGNPAACPSSAVVPNATQDVGFRARKLPSSCGGGGDAWPEADLTRQAYWTTARNRSFPARRRLYASPTFSLGNTSIIG